MNTDIIYFENNRIFLSPDIKEKFSQIDKSLWAAWADRKVGLNSSNSADLTLEAWDNAGAIRFSLSERTFAVCGHCFLSLRIW